MSLFIGFNLTAVHFPSPIVVLRDPVCQVEVSLAEGLTDFPVGVPCGKPATERVTTGHWSLPWCPDHAKDLIRVAAR